MQPVFGSTVTRTSEFSIVRPFVLRSVATGLPPDETWRTSYPRDGTAFTSAIRRYVCVEEIFDSSWKATGFPCESSTVNPFLDWVGICTSKIARSARRHANGFTTITGTPSAATAVLTWEEIVPSALVAASSVVQ